MLCNPLEKAIVIQPEKSFTDIGADGKSLLMESNARTSSWLSGVTRAKTRITKKVKKDYYRLVEYDFLKVSDQCMLALTDNNTAVNKNFLDIVGLCLCKQHNKPGCEVLYLPVDMAMMINNVSFHSSLNVKEYILDTIIRYGNVCIGGKLTDLVKENPLSHFKKILMFVPRKNNEWGLLLIKVGTIVEIESFCLFGRNLSEFTKNVAYWYCLFTGQSYSSDKVKCYHQRKGLIMQVKDKKTAMLNIILAVPYAGDFGCTMKGEREDGMN